MFSYLLVMADDNMVDGNLDFSTKSSLSVKNRYVSFIKVTLDLSSIDFFPNIYALFKKLIE